MFKSIAPSPVAAEQRTYHAQLITVLAVAPILMGSAALLTAAFMGDHDVRAALSANPLGAAVAVGNALLFVLAWWLLGRRHRAGVVLAVALFGWMLVSSFARSGWSYFDIAFSLVGLVLTARAWPAMRGPARPAPTVDPS